MNDRSAIYREDRFLSFLVAERDRHFKRLRFAVLMGLLIAVLLNQTKWLLLRPGLIILLAGQAAAVLFLAVRNVRIMKDLEHWRVGAVEEALRAAWFQGEERFLKRLAIGESVCQLVGFVVLGYGIWASTQSLLLTLSIGGIYPAALYFGMARGRNQKAVKRLRTECSAIEVRSPTRSS